MRDAPPAQSVDRRAWLALVCGAIAEIPFGRPHRLHAQGREVIKVGSTLALPPFQFIDQGGEIRGFEIDLVRAIAERLGFEVEFIKTPFPQAFVGLAAGKYRLNASNIYIRCERIGGPGRVGHFTVPTFDVSLSLSTRAEHADRARAMEGLAGLSVGVESRGTGADLLADRFKDTVGFRKVVFDSTAALFLALEQGRIDVALQSDAVARYALQKRRDLVVGPPLPGTAVPVGLLFREDDPLRLRFNTTIDSLKREGLTRRLYERWFGAAPDPRSAVVSVVPEVTVETCGTPLPRAPIPSRAGNG
jgi:ABC-type amino acid transport substrate-binding protein